MNFVMKVLKLEVQISSVYERKKVNIAVGARSLGGHMLPPPQKVLIWSFLLFPLPPAPPLPPVTWKK